MHKLGMLSRMAVDQKVSKSLHEIYTILKEDKNFTVNKYRKLMAGMLKGEKIISYEGKYILSAFLPPFPSKAFIQNIRAVEEKDNIFTQQIHGKRSAPISFYLCLTHRCPNNCVYCSSKSREEKYELTTEEWIKLIHDLQEMGTPIIGLTGGEPMLREDIYEMIHAIDDRSISTLFTSGKLLTLEKAKELKKSGLFSIGISLDSHDPDKHNQNRRDEKAFDYAIEAMGKAREAGIYTMAQTVVLKEQVDEENLMKLFKLAGESGAHEVKILEPILSGKLLTEENLDNILYDSYTRKKLIKIQHKANKRKDLPKITTFAYTESEEKYGCGAGTQHSYISASGQLYPCDFVPMNFGSVTENNIKTLWKEMNAAMGIPKIGCFAQQVNRQVFQKAEGKLPLDKEESIKICMKSQSNRFPRYYRDAQ